MRVYAVISEAEMQCLECANKRFGIDLSDCPQNVYDVFDTEVSYAHSWEISEDDHCGTCFVNLLEQF